MKTATFTYTGNPTGRKTERIYGKITLKYDGKVSISLNSPKFCHTYAAKCHAKLLAKEIVAANFDHPAVTSKNGFSQVDQKLVDMITNKTVDIKVDMVKHTKLYCDLTWDLAVKQNAYTKEQWYELYRVKDANCKEWVAMDNKRRKVADIVKEGKEELVKSEMKMAIDHYNDSIAKLAYRLTEKGLKKAEDLTIIKGRIGVNLELTFKFDDITVVAKTIRAEGPIQRAHFRYLVN